MFPPFWSSSTNQFGITFLQQLAQITSTSCEKDKQIKDQIIDNKSEKT
jgi:hypothetical protein